MLTLSWLDELHRLTSQLGEQLLARESRIANILKSELKRHSVTYVGLVEKLSAIGVDEKEVNIRNKQARGKFSYAFMIQYMDAIGEKEIRL